MKQYSVQYMQDSVAFSFQKPREPKFVLEPSFALKYVNCVVFKTAGTFVFVKKKHGNFSCGSRGFQGVSATLMQDCLTLQFQSFLALVSQKICHQDDQYHTTPSQILGILENPCVSPVNPITSIHTLFHDIVCCCFGNVLRSTRQGAPTS